MSGGSAAVRRHRQWPGPDRPSPARSPTCRWTRPAPGPETLGPGTPGRSCPCPRRYREDCGPRPGRGTWLPTEQPWDSRLAFGHMSWPGRHSCRVASEDRLLPWERESHGIPESRSARQARRWRRFERGGRRHGAGTVGLRPPGCAQILERHGHGPKGPQPRREPGHPPELRWHGRYEQRADEGGRCEEQGPASERLWHAALLEHLEGEVGDPRNGESPGEGEDPGPHDPSCHAPPHCREPLRRTHAHDGARDRVGRGHGNPCVGGEEQRGGSGGLRAHPAHGGEFGDARPHGVHDPPPAGERAQAYGRMGGKNDPDRYGCRGGQMFGGDQQGQDHSHGLLGVVPSVAEAERGSRHQLHAPEASVEPVNPWEEEVGRPKNHVMTSQAIAPIRPAKTTASEKTFASTTPLAMVLATFVPKMRKAMKLKKAAHPTARSGVSTRVDTTVAIELAASWNPLKKSKDSATRISRTRITGIPQACLSTIDSRVFATSSQPSMAASSWSTRSFHLRTSIALYSPENSLATVLR